MTLVFRGLVVVAALVVAYLLARGDHDEAAGMIFAATTLVAVSAAEKEVPRACAHPSTTC